MITSSISIIDFIQGRLEKINHEEKDAHKYIIDSIPYLKNQKISRILTGYDKHLKAIWDNLENIGILKKLTIKVDPDNENIKVVTKSNGTFIFAIEYGEYDIITDRNKLKKKKKSKIKENKSKEIDYNQPLENILCQQDYYKKSSLEFSENNNKNYKHKITTSYYNPNKRITITTNNSHYHKPITLDKIESHLKDHKDIEIEYANKDKVVLKYEDNLNFRLTTYNKDGEVIKETTNNSDIINYLNKTLNKLPEQTNRHLIVVTNEFLEINEKFKKLIFKHFSKEIPYLYFFTLDYKMFLKNKYGEYYRLHESLKDYEKYSKSLMQELFFIDNEKFRKLVTKRKGKQGDHEFKKFLKKINDYGVVPVESGITENIESMDTEFIKCHKIGLKNGKEIYAVYISKLLYRNVINPISGLFSTIKRGVYDECVKEYKRILKTNKENVNIKRFTNYHESILSNIFFNHVIPSIGRGKQIRNTVTLINLDKVCGEGILIKTELGFKTRKFDYRKLGYLCFYAFEAILNCFKNNHKEVIFKEYHNTRKTKFKEKSVIRKVAFNIVIEYQIGAINYKKFPRELIEIKSNEKIANKTD